MSSITFFFNTAYIFAQILYNLTWILQKSFLQWYIFQKLSRTSLRSASTKKTRVLFKSGSKIRKGLLTNFGLSNPVGKTANILDNLCIKPSNKISVHNIDFMCHTSQLE